MTRSCTAGCLASLLPALPEEELEPVMNDTVLVDDPSHDMTIRHGRSATLAVLMAQSPSTALVHQDKLVKTILSQFGADHVSIVTNGVRSAGYLILDTVTRSIQVFRVYGIQSASRFSGMEKLIKKCTHSFGPPIPII